MSVTNQTPINRYAANGVTTVFPYTFLILSSADIKVTVDGVTKTLTTDYSVSSVGTPSGGSVTFVTAPADGSTVVVKRNMAIKRDTDYQDNGDLLADTLNPDQDSPILILQQIAAALGLTLRAPDTDSASLNMELPDSTSRASKFLAFDADGQPIAADTALAGVPADASAIVFTQSGTGAVATTIQAKGRENKTSADFGADIQKGLDAVGAAGGGVLRVLPGEYLIARTKGTNDSWGLKITHSNVTLILDPGAILKRADTIATYADAYPILFIGVPDSNDIADQVRNVAVISSGYGGFEGNDTRHAISGAAASDKRYAIELKNTYKVTIDGVDFGKVDSAVIHCQPPDNYDYGNSAYYNTTKNYWLRFTNCRMEAEAHATAGRALIHAIRLQGVDHAHVSGNDALWCDCVVVPGTTYDDDEDVETDTYIGSAGVAVKRSGRYHTIVHNSCHNSSEHAIYTEGMDEIIHSNRITTDSPTICNTDQIKIRARNASVLGNLVSAAHAAISVAAGARNVGVNANVCNALIDNGSAAGVIDVGSTGQLAYIAARPWLATNYPVANVTVASNTIRLPEVAQTGGAALRIQTDTSAGALANGHLRNVTISGNAAINANIGLDVEATAGIAVGVRVVGNSLRGKPFTEASFVGAAQNITASDASADTFTCAAHGLAVDDAITIVNNVALTITSSGTGTTIAQGGVYYVAAVVDVDNFKLAQLKGGTVVNVTNNGTGTFKKINALSSLAMFRQRSGNDFSAAAELTVANNSVTGFRYVFYTSAAAGTNRIMPYGVQGNHLNFNYQLFNNAWLGLTTYTCFKANTGKHLPGREWQSSVAWGNSLLSGTGAGENYGQILMISSSDVRICTDDNGTYKAL